MKQEDHPTVPHQPQPAADPYAFTPTTPRPPTPQDDIFHHTLRLSHSVADSYSGHHTPKGVAPSGDPAGDLYHRLPPEPYGPPTPSSAHASPAHAISSTPPRPSQFGPSPGVCTFC